MSWFFKTTAIIFLLVLILAGCSVPTPTADTPSPIPPATPSPTITPEVTPPPTSAPEFDAHRRKKLFDDDVYVTMPSRWQIPGANVPIKQFVYNNYGEIVAEFVSDDIEPSVNGKYDVIAVCSRWEYNREYNLFSFEKLDYLFNDKAEFRDSYDDYPDKYKCEIANNIFKVFSAGKTYTCEIPDGDYYVLHINDSIVYLSSDRDDKLILYKIGKDISDFIKSDDYGRPTYWSDKYVFIKYGFSDGYTILDADGEVIYYNESKINLDPSIVGGDYLGHDLFKMYRGNYYGVVNEDGDWVVRSLLMMDDV